MARLPHCSECIHSKDLFGTECKFHPEGIPNNILIEERLCEHYSTEKLGAQDGNHEGLPIAKGR